jgi:hypothetical protein
MEIKTALYIIALVYLFFVLLNCVFFLLATYHKEGIFYNYRKNVSLLDKEMLQLSWIPIVNMFVILEFINKDWKHLKYR